MLIHLLIEKTFESNPLDQSIGPSVEHYQCIYIYYRESILASQNNQKIDIWSGGVYVGTPAVDKLMKLMHIQFFLDKISKTAV